jgi:hypothetical protein
MFHYRFRLVRPPTERLSLRDLRGFMFAAEKSPFTHRRLTEKTAATICEDRYSPGIDQSLDGGPDSFFEGAFSVPAGTAALSDELVSLFSLEGFFEE